MSRRVRLQDVAERAGVSAATASMVLNGKVSSIGAGTQERVRRAADELGYRPNALARGLRSQSSRMIGFLCDQVLTTPHAGDMIRGAQDVADERDYALILANTDGSPEANKLGIDALLDRRVDAVVYAAMYHQVIEVPSGLGGLPVVLLDARTADGSGSSVVPDEIGGATAAVEHLIAAGHRHIGFINDDSDPLVPAAVERQRAFRDTLAAHGLPWSERLEAAAPSYADGGLTAALRLLDTQDPPTALFCFNDRMAAGAYRAAHRLGLTIPEDLSIVGFDNQVLVADAIDPGLTTVQLPHVEMGRWAVEQALTLLDEQAQPYARRMPCPLVERESVAPPKHR